MKLLKTLMICFALLLSVSSYSTPVPSSTSFSYRDTLVLKLGRDSNIDAKYHYVKMDGTPDSITFDSNFTNYKTWLVPSRSGDYIVVTMVSIWAPGKEVDGEYRVNCTDKGWSQIPNNHNMTFYIDSDNRPNCFMGVSP